MGRVQRLGQPEWDGDLDGDRSTHADTDSYSYADTNPDTDTNTHTSAQEATQEAQETWWTRGRETPEGLAEKDGEAGEEGRQTDSRAQTKAPVKIRTWCLPHFPKEGKCGPPMLGLDRKG